MDMSKYKAMFISETAEHLQSMSRGLVKIEQNPEEQEAIAEVFRNAHSIKGMAASMGFEPIRDLAHAMEDVMDDVREGTTRPEAEAMDLLFQGLDLLEKMLSQVENDLEFSGEGEELAARIRSFRETAGEKPAAETAPSEEPKKTTGQEEDKPEIDLGDMGMGEIEAKEETRTSPPPKLPELVFDDDLDFALDEETEEEVKAPEPVQTAQAAGDEYDLEEEEDGFDDEVTFTLEDAGLASPPPPKAAAPAATRPGPAPVPPEPESPEKAAGPRRSIKVIFSPQTASPGVRGLILFKRLGEVGQILDSRPPADEVKAGNFLDDPKGLAVEIDFQADSGEAEIIEVIKSMTDVEAFEVTAPEAGPAQAAAQAEDSAEPAEARDKEPAYDPFAQVQSLPQTVRVKTMALDGFINALGEMILVKSELREVAKRHPIGALTAGLDKLEGLVKDFYDQVMSIRMMPLESVVQRLPRVVRDLARDEGKKIRFEITGVDIELDRAILEQLTDPLIHLLRNCVNHGIETPEEREKMGKPGEGVIVLEGYRMRDLALIEVRDDGRGMDPFAIKEAAAAKGVVSAEQAAKMTDEDALQLIFTPGFSTAKKVGMVSGRGVGMDAVKNVVEGVGGFVTINTVPGSGTTFTLHLPRTIAIVNVLLVKLLEEVFAVPLTKVQKTVEILPHQVRVNQGKRFYLDRQEMVPMKPLHRFLDLEEPKASPRDAAQALIVEAHNRKVALLVDDLIGQEEAFIRPLGKPLERISGLSGVTMLGDGKMVFVLDTMSLL